MKTNKNDPLSCWQCGTRKAPAGQVFCRQCKRILKAADLARQAAMIAQVEAYMTALKAQMAASQVIQFSITERQVNR